MRMFHVFEKNLIFGKTGFKQLDVRMHKLYYIRNIILIVNIFLISYFNSRNIIKFNKILK